MHLLDIIIPTYNNYECLAPALQSILDNGTADNLFHITVINNGHKKSCDWIKNDNITVITTGKNLGWEGALKLGLTKTKAKYVMFLNDDVHVPKSSRMWLNNMLQFFNDPKVGAVGPSSNVVMGSQNIFNYEKSTAFAVKYLIGFCFLTERSKIMEAGGIDDTLPGGDDLDMSIRLRDLGYKLVCDKNTFVYHHGFKTGNRLHGDSKKRNGWNSYEMMEKTNKAIIRKHGFRKWAETIVGGHAEEYISTTMSDSEGNLIREELDGGVILDLGCGGNKTVPEAIGVDMIPNNKEIETLKETKSQADVVADLNDPLPFEKNSIDTIICRHILEHIHDSVTFLTHLRTLLKPGGKLIIAVPDSKIFNGIPMNIQHCHAFDTQSMKSLLEVIGFKVNKQMSGENRVSFITISEK